MDEYLTFSASDGIVLTFIATWFSVRQQLWVKSSSNMILIILAILCFSTLIMQIRIFTKTKQKSLSILTVFGSITFVIIFLYFYWNDNTYFQQSDIVVVGSLLGIWLLLPLCGLIDRKIDICIRKKS